MGFEEEGPLKKQLVRALPSKNSPNHLALNGNRKTKPLRGRKKTKSYNLITRIIPLEGGGNRKEREEQNDADSDQIFDHSSFSRLTSSFPAWFDRNSGKTWVDAELIRYSQTHPAWALM
ncbi:hypothetical protein NPIL_470491 [Nephila pilipes]|uniref:Uncharacterized protein n=1 Tax=Nephila pilipes TaxID=299642 RepID=A0A8X6KDM2_NEPPI|nr:hypothetical protein NPIL_470491 [Nephila pilipes]